MPDLGKPPAERRPPEHARNPTKQVGETTVENRRDTSVFMNEPVVECTICSALVLDPAKHLESVHTKAAPTPPPQAGGTK